MRVATFLLCLLGAVSVSVLSNEGADDSSRNEAGSTQFPRCEACLQSILNARSKLVQDRATILKQIIKRVFCGTYQHPECQNFINNVDADKLIGFVTGVKSPLFQCGATDFSDDSSEPVSTDNWRCIHEPTTDVLLVPFVANRIENWFDRNSAEYNLGNCDKCKNIVRNLRTLLQQQDAQTEAKKFMGLACSRVLSYWTDRRSKFEPPADTRWCREARRWDGVVEVLVSTLRDTDHFCSPMCGVQRRPNYSFIAKPNLERALIQLYNHSITPLGVTDGYANGCVSCKLGRNRLKENFEASVDGDRGFIRHVESSAAKLCDLMSDEKYHSCVRKLDTFVHYCKWDVIEGLMQTDCITDQSNGPTRCTNEDINRIEEMSHRQKDRLLCESCKYTLSAVKEGLKNRLVARELDQIAAMEINGMDGIRPLFKDVWKGSLEGTFGPSYLAKLAEYINPRDQCKAMKMCR